MWRGIAKLWQQPELFTLEEVTSLFPVVKRKKQTRIFNSKQDKWRQQDLFNIEDPGMFIPIKKRRTRKPVDYEALYKLFLAGPVRFKEIEEATGVSHNAVAQVITTLSLRYPIYEVKRGLYKLYGDEEYGDGIKKYLNYEQE